MKTFFYLPFIPTIVLDCIEKNCGIEDLTVEELKNYSDKFEEDIYENIDLVSAEGQNS